MLIRIEYGENCPLLESYLNSDIDEFRNLIASGENINFIENRTKLSLICKIICNHKNIKEELNKQFFDALLDSNVFIEKIEDNRSPLFCSFVENLDIYYMDKLLKKGVEFNCESVCDINNNYVDKSPPIFHLIKRCGLEKINLFLQYNPNLKIKDYNGLSILHCLIRSDPNDCEEIANLLLSSGADPNALNLDQNSLLHQISYGCNCWKFDSEKLLQLLLDHNADINIKDLKGYTPIFCACETGNMKAFKVLIKNKASLTEKNEHGFNCAMIAAENGRYGMLNILEKNGVDFSVKNNFGENIGHFLARIGQNRDSVGAERMKMLKKHYKLLTVKNNKNVSALDMIKENNASLYKDLCEFIENKNKAYMI